MIFYKEVEAAEVCHPFEAAEWLALGRVPEYFFDGHDGDARVSLRAESNDYTPDTDLILSPSEFRAYGVEISYQDYLDATFFISGLQENLRRMETQKGIEGSESRLQHAFELAKLEVMKAMIDGRLTAFGFKFPAYSMEEELDEDAEIERIPADKIRLDGFDWSTNHLSINSGYYRLVHIPFPEILAAFPTPQIEKTTKSGILTGSTLILDELTQDANTPRRRYRRDPGKLNIGKIVQLEFERRFKQGALPSKKEAVYAEAMEWAELVLGKKPSRAAVQRYLVSLYDNQ